ncbi:MAG: hypothetical protein ACT4TC_24245 [Myxococcaceae bacterium]
MRSLLRNLSAEAEYIFSRAAEALGGRVVRRGDQWKWRYGAAAKEQFDLDMASSGQRANWSIFYLAQVLAVTHDEELVAYQLDDEARGAGEKMCDGVLIGRIVERSIVCFVELKTTLKDKEGMDRSERALQQLEAAVTHFHPAERSGGSRTHGDDHHDAWRDGDDTLVVMPARDHEVVAIVVAYRAVPRRPPEPPRKVGQSVVFRAVIQVSPAQMNRAETSFSRLLQLAGR